VTLTDQAYAGIRTLICTGELPPGEVISEVELQENLGLGRTPIREAIRALASEHLIDVFPRRGTFVASVDPRNLRAMSEVRAQLEPMAARLAAERRTHADVVQFGAALAELEELERGDLREQERALIELDSKIHQLIYQATQNAYLAHDLDRYYIHSLRIWNLGLGRVGHLRQAVLEHKELLEAIIQGDSDRAFNVMSKHVSEFEAEIAQAL
jgi:DNA-binding GntR family transcriptional regulator